MQRRLIYVHSVLPKEIVFNVTARRETGGYVARGDDLPDKGGITTQGETLSELEEMIADIDNGLRVEDGGFAELIEGSAVSMEEIRRRSYGGWYLTAPQALELGLVAGLI